MNKSALEMALPIPNPEEHKVFVKYIESADYLPTFKNLIESNFMEEIRAAAYTNQPFDKHARHTYNVFGSYDKLELFFDRIINPLTLFWNARGDRDALIDLIDRNPQKGDRNPPPHRNPFDYANVPQDSRIIWSIQAIRNWIDYYGGGFYALWRPELKRMINEIAVIAKKKRVSPYRPPTPRSVHPTANAVRTLQWEIEPVDITDLQGNTITLYQLIVKIVLQGGLIEKRYREYFMTEQEAYRANLFKEAGLLSVPDYMKKFKDFEVID
jgi:hypothetical protein